MTESTHIEAEIKTYSMLAYKWEGLLALVERTNRNLAKKGYTETVGVSEPIFYVGDYSWSDSSVWPPVTRTRKEQMVKFEILGVCEVSGGAQFIAAVDHVGEANIIVPMSAGAEETLGAEYFESLKTCGATCDHCGFNRNRSQTVVVLKDGALLRVGKSCLEAYLDCPAALSLYRFLYSAFELMGADDEDSEGGFGRTTGYDTETVIAATLRLTENGKFYDREYIQSNIHSFFAVRPEPGLAPLTTEEFEKANEVIEWVLNTFTGKNTYEHNVLTFLRAEWVRFKYLNFVIGVVAAWSRANTVRAEKVIKTNEHVGQVKDKVELDLTLVKVAGFDGAYGWTTIYMFEDEAGRSFKWFTGTVITCPVTGEEVEVGAKIKLKGTIKGHGEYKERKETMLTRCKVVEFLVAATPLAELSDLEDADLLRLEARAHNKPELWTQELADVLEERQVELFGEVFGPDGKYSRHAEARAFTFWDKRRCPQASFGWMVLEANTHRFDELDQFAIFHRLRDCDAGLASSFENVIEALIAEDRRRNGDLFEMGKPSWVSQYENKLAQAS